MKQARGNPLVTVENGALIEIFNLFFCINIMSATEHDGGGRKTGQQGYVVVAIFQDVFFYLPRKGWTRRNDEFGVGEVRSSRFA